MSFKSLFSNALYDVRSTYRVYGENVVTKIDVHKPYIVYGLPNEAPRLYFGNLNFRVDGTISSSDTFSSLPKPDSSTGCKKDGQCIKCFLTDEEYASLLNPSSLPNYTPPPEKSTAKLDVVSTAPNVNVTTVNNNVSSGSMSLLLGIKLCNPTPLEEFVWKMDEEKLGTVLVGFGKKGASYTTNLVNGLTNLSPFQYSWKSGRDYILTLYAPSGMDTFGDGTALQTLDSVQVTIDGEMQPAPDIPVGNTTYSPTPPKTPATGDVNVIVNDSGNVTGVQQWDGNQWIIIEKIEINNNGGSGGTDPDNPGGGTDPDNPDDPDKPGILDWLWNGIGKILGGIVDAISKILDAVFGRLVELIVGLLQQIADAVVRVFDLLFTVLDRVLGAMTGGFTDFLKAFFYFLPPELVDGLTLTVIFGIILAIVRFFKGG